MTALPSSRPVTGPSGGWSSSSPVSPRTEEIAQTRAESGVQTLTAFGLDLELEGAVPLLGRPRAASTGRTVRVRVQTDAQEQLEWPPDGQRICDERMPDDSPCFRIESHPSAGYLIGGPRFGLHLLSADGGEVRSWPDGEEWQRLLIAQVLPFTALVRGLEVLHASAVVRNGRAIALLGPSGAGKTSVALELVRSGASFLADDVLALELRGEELLGHPGTPVAGVAREEVERLRREDRWRSNDAHPAPSTPFLSSNHRELLIGLPGALQPAPLAAAFFLDRRTSGSAQPRFEPAADAKLLLSATFNFVLSTGERLTRLLEVCSLMARLPTERVIVGPELDAGSLAAAIEQRVSAA